MTTPVSVRLDESIKARMQELAGQRQRPAHTVHLSTGQPMMGRQKPLVKIQRAELVNFKRAPTELILAWAA